MSEVLTLLCKLDDLVEDEGIKIDLPGRAALAVFLHDGKVHVTDDLCTHGPASLSEGLCDAGEIECPFHMGRFSLATGEPTHSPCYEALAIHAHRVIDDMVYLVE